jgi:hypothetical protein
MPSQTMPLGATALLSDVRRLSPYTDTAIKIPISTHERNSR